MNRLSVLNEVPGFDLCRCLPHDIMHVILEGVLPQHIQFLLHHMIFVKHYFTLQQLNQQIENFPYGFTEEVNKPRSIDRDRIHSTDQKLVQSGKSGVDTFWPYLSLHALNMYMYMFVCLN